MESWESGTTDTEDEVRVEESQLVVTESTEQKAIIRRTQLPSPPVGDEGSLFAVLKKNVGKV